MPEHRLGPGHATQKGCRMVTGDGTGSSPAHKTRGRGRSYNKRQSIRHRSVRLVKNGTIDLAPCAVCGTWENLTIHHIKPLRADRFVFLCETCHVLAHNPVYWTMRLCVAPGHFSVLPEAILPRKEVTCG